MKYLPAAFLATITVLSFATVASSQTMNRQGPPIADMAADLGVSEAALETCMPRPEGERGERGERPSRADHEARMNDIASCLQGAGSNVTAEEFGAVMEKYRPKPRGNG